MEFEITNELLEQAIQGDCEAFEKIIFQYEKLIFNIAYRMFNNIEDAKDLTQEILIKIYKNIDKCNDIATIKSWICKIATNTCIDEIRKRKIRISPDSIDDAFQIQDKAETPEQSIVRKEGISEIENAINNLGAECKQIIILRDINELSYNEISEATGLQLGTVKSKLSRCRNSLKNLFLKIKEQNKK